MENVTWVEAFRGTYARMHIGSAWRNFESREAGMARTRDISTVSLAASGTYATQIAPAVEANVGSGVATDDVHTLGTLSDDAGEHDYLSDLFRNDEHDNAFFDELLDQPLSDFDFGFDTATASHQPARIKFGEPPLFPKLQTVVDVAEIINSACNIMSALEYGVDHLAAILPQLGNHSDFDLPAIGGPGQASLRHGSKHGSSHTFTQCHGLNVRPRPTKKSPVEMQVSNVASSGSDLYASARSVPLEELQSTIRVSIPESPDFASVHTSGMTPHSNVTPRGSARGSARRSATSTPTSRRVRSETSRASPTSGRRSLGSSTPPTSSRQQPAAAPFQAMMNHMIDNTLHSSGAPAGNAPYSSWPDEADHFTAAGGAFRRETSHITCAPVNSGSLTLTSSPSDTVNSTVIRTYSQDFAVNPKTGEQLRFGPAMQEAFKTVRLPAITALFHDISSAQPIRPWSLRPQSPSVRQSRREASQPLNCMGATVGVTAGSNATDHLSVHEEHREHEAAEAPQPLLFDWGIEANDSRVPGAAKPVMYDQAQQFQSPSAARLHAATRGQRATATEHQIGRPSDTPTDRANALLCSNGVEDTIDVQMQPSNPTPLPALHSERSVGGDRSASTDKDSRTASVQKDTNLDAEVNSTIDLEYKSPRAPRFLSSPPQQQQSGSPESGSHRHQMGTALTPAALRPPHMQGMGDITSGVVRAAALKQAAEHTELRHQQEAPLLCQKGALHGVSRGLWQTAWDAHLSVNGRQEAIWLGAFPSKERAARAHDNAALHTHGMEGSSLPTDSQIVDHSLGLADLKGLPPADMMDALRHAVPEQHFQPASKFIGVYPKGNGWEARYPIGSCPTSH